MKRNILVKKNQDNPETTELIAESIIKIADAFEKIKKSKLTERALHVLIKDAVGNANGIGIPAIKEVLAAIGNLKKYYIKESIKK